MTYLGPFFTYALCSIYYLEFTLKPKLLIDLQHRSSDFHNISFQWYQQICKNNNIK